MSFAFAVAVAVAIAGIVAGIAIFFAGRHLGGDILRLSREDRAFHTLSLALVIAVLAASTEGRHEVSGLLAALLFLVAGRILTRVPHWYRHLLLICPGIPGLTTHLQLKLDDLPEPY